VRITTQLSEATTGEQLWAERYERPLQDIFALQDEIREKIVLALKVKLTPEEQERFRRAPTANLEAYDYYLRGYEAVLRALQEVKQELNEQARQRYEKAIELDSQYAGAYAWLGWTYFLDGFYGWSGDRMRSFDRAAELAQRAVALEDSLSTPHWVLGQVALWKKQHDQAIVEGERAVALNVNDTDSYVSLGNTLVFAGRPEEGIELIQKAMRLNPHYPPRYLNLLGLAYRTAGKCDEALVPLRKASTLSPNFVPVHFNLAGCYAELDRLTEARSAVAEILRINPNASLEKQRIFMPYKNSADMERSLTALRKAGLK
jgi:adenylate cyclase